MIPKCLESGDWRLLRGQGRTWLWGKLASSVLGSWIFVGLLRHACLKAWAGNEKRIEISERVRAIGNLGTELGK